jgi:hypothetical protein
MTRADRGLLALVVVMGLFLVASAIAGWRNETQMQAQAEFWRAMYLRADHDAKYVNCVEVDDNFVMCEKPKP